MDDDEERSAYFFWCLVGVFCLMPYEVLAHAGHAQETQEPPSSLSVSGGQGVVATVNQMPITSQELDRAVNSSLPRAYGHRQLSEERIAEIKKDVLEDLIQKEL